MEQWPAFRSPEGLSGHQAVGCHGEAEITHRLREFAGRHSGRGRHCPLSRPSGTTSLRLSPVPDAPSSFPRRLPVIPARVPSLAWGGGLLPLSAYRAVPTVLPVGNDLPSLERASLPTLTGPRRTSPVKDSGVESGSGQRRGLTIRSHRVGWG